MVTFQIGETVLCDLAITKAAAAYSPDTSTKIYIYDPDGTVDVDGTAMTENDTGDYTYAYDTTGKSAGIYRVRYIAVDGGNTTIKDSSFKLET